METEKRESMMNYGWTTYKKLGWKNEAGKKLYQGHFRAEKGVDCWRIVVIRFWASRPILALREICKRLSAGEKIDDYTEIN